MSDKPTYDDNNITNLMASLSGALGAETEYPALSTFPSAELTNYQNIVLIVIDGLGYGYVCHHPHSFLYRNLRARLTTVFPSTTASAISAFLSGFAPQQHGITGWYVYLRELGSVAAVLPFQPRHGGPTYQQMGIDARHIFDWVPFFDRIRPTSYINTARYIVNSACSVVTGGSARRCGYDSLDEFFNQTRDIVLCNDERKYIYAYWPQLDSLAHQSGIKSKNVSDHFTQIDQALERLIEQLHGTNTAVIVCADHGLIDTSPERTIRVEHHPALADTLALPLCGEPRTAYCYVRGTKHRQFKDYVVNELGHCCDVVSSEQLIEEQFFGLGKAHPRLSQRVGDYTLLMKNNYIIKDAILGESEFTQIGVHGGWSPEERYVPLITCFV